MGVVYRAFDTKTRSDVALKAMRDIPDPAAVELFAREWGVLAGMSHPNIVDVRDVGEIEEKGRRTPFFVMPLLSGSTLAKLIETGTQRLTPGFVVEIMLQVCRGLQAAHERGLIHRDLKPSNIFVLDDDTAKIIDFGVVHLADAHSVSGHKGTWQYMAPEVTELHPATPVSDVFSLGVVCYEALTGRRPFARRTALETVEAVRKYTPPSICDINPAVPPLLAAAAHKAMAKQAVHRFASAREFADALRRAHLGQPAERLEPADIQQRIERARKAFGAGDYPFALEILTGLQSEGHIDPEIAPLAAQVEEAFKQKRIRQLLEDAKARVEQDETALAQEKLRGVLELDPDNPDALLMRREIEQRRAGRKLENWLALTRRHLEQNNFAQARQALTEALSVSPDDSRCAELAEHLEEAEGAALRTREEKERLYDSAVRAFHKGEIRPALARLEKLLALGGAPDAAGRDAVYQSFYSQVRAEWDSIQSGYQEGRRLLAAKEFAQVLGICDRLLGQHPGHPLLQALRLEAAETERQELSAYSASIQGRAESEADLDRKVEIFQEATERYPAEAQFRDSLKLARDRRDLVHSIAGKARQYAEKNQFHEALEQWEILRNIYPQFPGLAFEIEHLARQRECQEREDARLGLVAKIDRALETHAFRVAHELAEAGLTRFPSDGELLSLERLAREGLDRVVDAQRLLEHSQAAAEAGRQLEQVDLLRRALELDDRNRAIRAALGSVLTERARSLVDEDWRTAETWIDEAAAVDAGQAAIQNLRTIVAAARHKEEVSRCLAEARELQRAGNPAAALEKVTEALAAYPEDQRLAQYAIFLNGILRDERNVRTPEATAQAPDPPPATPAPQPAPQPARSTETTLFSSSGYGAAPAKAPAAAPPEIVRQVTPARDKWRWRRGIRDTGARCAAWFHALASGSRGRVRELKRFAVALRIRAARPAGRAEWRRRLHLPRTVWLAAIGVLLLVAWIVAAELHRPARPAPPGVRAPTTTRVTITTDPPDAVVTIDGRAAAGLPVDLVNRPHAVTVSKRGYITLREEETPRASWLFHLAAEPLRVRIFTTGQDGEVLVDGHEAGKLTDGAFPDLEMPADGRSHTISVRARTGDLFSAGFVARAGAAARLDPIDTKGLIAVSSLGNDATVYSGSAGRNLLFGAGEPRAIPAAGVDLLGLTEQNREFSLATPDRPSFPIEAGNAPVLSFWLTGSHDSLPYAIVGVDAPDAHLYVDGQEARKMKPGYWRIQKNPGAYTMRITADGFSDYQESLTFKAGEVLNLHPALKPNPVLARISIANGTPGAEVVVGGKSIGTMDDSGAFSGSDIPPGEWPVELRKPGYQPKQMQLKFAAGETANVADAALTASGAISFQIAPGTAKVQYRRGDTVAGGATSGTVPAPAGHYRVTASAPGMEDGSADVDVRSGETARVVMTLRPVTPAPPPMVTPKPTLGIQSLFQDPSVLRHEDDGWTLAGESVAWLVPGVHRFLLSLIKPGRGRLQFRIDADAQNGVLFEFSGRRIWRSASLAGKRSSATLLKPSKGAAELAALIRIEPNHVVLAGAGGEILDDLQSDTADFTKSKLGVFGDAHFTLRSY